VVGIEVDSPAAAEAARYYDRVYAADLDEFDVPFPPESFDYMVCADVLEHLKDPWKVLDRMRPSLRGNGAVVASIPNIANASAVAGLLRGRFDYVDWGILDMSHLRFFTRRTIEEMFAGAGYAVREIRARRDANADAILDLWQRHDIGRRIHDLTVLLGGEGFTPTARDLEQLLTIQYLVFAQRDQ